MAAEIDRLEINISANATDAESKVSALADSLEKLARASGTSANGLYKDADGIAAIKDAAKNVDSVAKSTEILVSSFSSISSIQPAQNLSRLAQSFKPLKDISSSISGFANTKNVDRVMDNISSIAMGLQSLSMMDTSGIENIKNLFSEFEGFGVNPDVANSLSTITSSIKRLSGIEFNETLSDNLRLFIDTVHAITDDDAKRISDIADAARGLSEVMDETGNKEVSGLDTSKVKLFSEEYWSLAKQGAKDAISNIKDGIGSEISRIKSDVKELYEIGKGIGKFVNVLGKIGASGVKSSVGWIMSPIKKVGSGFANAAKKAGEFFSSIKRIAMYRAIRTAMKAISQGFQEGRENLYQYSLLINGEFAKSMDMAATSFLYLKNSIGAATAPLTNYFVPILDRMVDRIVEVINRFNELTAVLTGASTWTKAIKYPTQWQEAADDANAAAKKLKTTMLGFDELNVIEPPSNSSGSAAESGLDYSKMFEEVKVDVGLSEDTKSRIPSLFEPIMSAWDNEGMNTLTKISDTWKNIRDLVTDVRDSFVSVWENGTGQQTLETILRIIGSIVGTFGNLARGIKKAWDNNSNGIRIMQTIWDIGNNVLTVFGNIWSDIEEWASTVDFEPAIKSLTALFEAIKRITDPDGTLARLFGKVWKKVLLPLGTWVIEEGVPAVIDLVTTAIVGLGYALEKYEPQINSFLDFLRELGGFTADNFIGVVTSIKVGIQTLMGEDVSNEDIEKLEKQREAQKSFLSRFEKLGYNAFDRDNPNAAATGTWGEGDEDYILHPDGYDYEAGQALHIAEMQSKWDSPTKITSGFERWFKGGQGIDFKTSNATWGNDNEDTLNFVNAWLTGMRLGSIGGNHSLKEAVGDGGLLKFFADETDSPVMDALYAGSVATKDMSFWDAWKAGLGISGKSESGGKSGASTTVASTAMIGGVNWDAALDPKEAQSTLQKIKGFFTDFKTNWNTGWDSIKQTASSKWENFKTDWSTGWDSIKKTAGDKWENFKTDWGNGVETIKQKWEGFKSNWGTGWDSIKKSANEKWSSFQSDWGSGVETIKQKWEDFKKSWSDGWNQIYLYAQKMVGKVVSVALWIWQGSNGDGGIKKVINSMLSGIEGFFNFFVNGINFLINQLNSISINIPEKVRDIAGFAGIEIPANVSLNIPTISAFNLPRLATGGVVDTGQLFIARERGAELVGNYGNRTAVMNNDQIVDAVATGVYRAVTDAMQNNSQNGTSEIKVYLDGRQIVTRTEEIKREKGASLIGGVVFA